MSPTPEIQERPAADYAAIAADVTMETMADVLPPLTPRLAEYLAKRGLEPCGPPFWRYRVIDMTGVLRVEVGFPLAAELDEQVDMPGDVVSGVLPAGTYVTTMHVGAPDELLDATSALLAWGDDAGLEWDRTTEPDGDHWTCRLEEYLSDPADEPDQTKWRTRLAFKTRSGAR
ncbi:GyrI-like domain-containing protein [Curtobacterium pusillum]|uniref:GyrI-like domain-containing protein n=1 Tax=Curtobacterium pusillum TaxID=69373 RepID=UPI00119EB4CD|nr:GyrI-like domain-containing protein [Curtobacterium pusillum]